MTARLISRRVFLAASMAVVGLEHVRAHDASNEKETSIDPLGKVFGGPFSLVNQSGQPVSDKDFLGSYLLLFFGYTSCPDLCSVGLTIMTEALDTLGKDADQIQPVFVTVDPAKDTPEILSAYIKNFHPRLMGLTGTEAQVADVAKIYKVHRRKLKSNEGGGGYVVDHGSLTYLMGKDGKFLTLLPYTVTASRMADVVKSYLK